MVSERKKELPGNSKVPLRSLSSPTHSIALIFRCYSSWSCSSPGEQAERDPASPRMFSL